MKKKTLIGAIAGDIIGSVHENKDPKKNFPLFTKDSKFTDDTVLTAATAFSIMYDVPYDRSYRMFTNKYPGRGFGSMFKTWAASPDARGYASFSNGAAMRVSPIGLYYDTPAEVMYHAHRSAIPTHDHPESILGAQIVALAVHFASRGIAKANIKKYIHTQFKWDVGDPEIKKGCLTRDTVPMAVFAFMDNDMFVDVIKSAVMMGGDTDTVASMAGAIAVAADMSVDQYVVTESMKRVDKFIRAIVNDFDNMMRLKSKLNRSEFADWKKDNKAERKMKYMQILDKYERSTI